MIQTKSSIEWAEVLSFPGAPKTSQFGGTDRPLRIRVRGVESSIYFPVGHPLEAAQVGDQLVVEWRSNKWRLCSTQPPELLATLSSRSAYPPSAPAPQLYALPSPSPSPSPSSSPSSSPDIQEYVSIFLQFRQLLPDIKEETIRAAASTIYIQRHKA